MKKSLIIFWIITAIFVLSSTTFALLIPDDNSGTNDNTQYQCDVNGNLARCTGMVECVNVQGANFDCVRNKCTYKGTQGPCSDGTAIGQCSKKSPGLRCIEGPLGSPSLGIVANDPCCKGGTTPTTQPNGCNKDGSCNPSSGETIQNCPTDCTCNNNEKCDPPTETPQTCKDCAGLTPDNSDANYFKDKTISTEEYNRVYFIIYQDRVAKGTKFTDNELTDIIDYFKSNEKALSGKLYTKGSKSNEIIGTILMNAGANFGNAPTGTGLCTDHDDCSQTCNTYCPAHRFGCCDGCNIGQCVNGVCQCQVSTTYCGTKPNYQVGSLCTGGGTTTCTDHDDCSQTCSSQCPAGVYGCCSGCDIGQCVSGTCQCVRSESYCANNPAYQVWAQCTSATTTPPTTLGGGCTGHDECSQTCSSQCPAGVYGCCDGCQIGQCVQGTCKCQTSQSYCGNSPTYQVGTQCNGGGTTNWCYDAIGEGQVCCVDQNVPNGYCWANKKCDTSTNTCVAGGGGGAVCGNGICESGETTSSCPSDCSSSSSCTSHDECSQTCSSQCPAGVYGCCDGCQIGQCVQGTCKCQTSQTYCGNSPTYQVGTQCNGGGTTNWCYDAVTIYGTACCKDQNAPYGYCWVGETCDTSTNTCVAGGGGGTTTPPTTLGGGCTSHDECSQTCSSQCPAGVYGCCSGCDIGQCVNGNCKCVRSESYCGNNPAYQVWAQCTGGGTSNWCYDAVSIYGDQCCVDQNAPYGRCWTNKKCQGNVCVNSGGGGGGCTSDWDCPTGQTCSNGKCTGGGGGGGQKCRDGTPLGSCTSNPAIYRCKYSGSDLVLESDCTCPGCSALCPCPSGKTCSNYKCI